MLAAPEHPEIYESFFLCPVVFGAENDVFTIDEPTRKTKLLTGNAELAGINDHAAAAYLARFDRDDIVSQLRQTLIKGLSSGELTQEKVAKDLAMSVRSLQRALKIKKYKF